MDKVLVTGAGGFIGSHLVEWLVERGYGVRALVRYRSDGDCGWLTRSPLRPAIDIAAGDVRDADALAHAMRGCRAVVHLAALVGIPYSYVSPLAYVRTNIEGTYNVLEAARAAGAERVLVTSTSETYGAAEYVPIDERHPVSARSPYAATKIGADQLALAHHRAFGLPVTIVRPFNAYGPRQSLRAVVPTIIVQLLAGRTVLRLGHVHPTRDLTHVADTARAFEAILRAPTLIGEVVNVGMRAEIPIGDLARRIGRLLRCAPEIETDRERLRPAASEVERLCCDNRRLLAATDWHPTHTLESGLAHTIDWFREHPLPTGQADYRT